MNILKYIGLSFDNNDTKIVYKDDYSYNTQLSQIHLIIENEYSNKKTLIKYILSSLYKQYHIENGIYFYNSNDKIKKYKLDCEIECKLDCSIECYTYDTNFIEKIISQKQVNLQKGIKNKKMIIIFDNFLNKIINSDNNLFKLIKNSKVYNIFLILTVNNIIDIKPQIRYYIKYIYTFKEINYNTIKKIYNNYFDIIESFDKFNDLITKIENDTVIIHDITNTTVFLYKNNKIISLSNLKFNKFIFDDDIDYKINLLRKINYNNNYISLLNFENINLLNKLKE